MTWMMVALVAISVVGGAWLLFFLLVAWLVWRDR